MYFAGAPVALIRCHKTCTRGPALQPRLARCSPWQGKRSGVRPARLCVCSLERPFPQTLSKASQIAEAGFGPQSLCNGLTTLPRATTTSVLHATEVCTAAVALRFNPTAEGIITSLITLLPRACQIGQLTVGSALPRLSLGVANDGIRSFLTSTRRCP